MKNMPRHLLCGAFLVLVLLPLGSGCFTAVTFLGINPGGRSRSIVRVERAYAQGDHSLQLLLWVRERGEKEETQFEASICLTREREVYSEGLARMRLDGTSLPIKTRVSWSVCQGWNEQWRTSGPPWRVVPVQVWSRHDPPRHAGEMRLLDDELVVVELDIAGLNVCYFRRNEVTGNVDMLWTNDQNPGLYEPWRPWLYPVLPVAVAADVAILPVYLVLVPIWARNFSISDR